MSDLTAGDIVRLNSGGPAMTISGSPEPGKVICHWFNKDDIREFTFNMIEVNDVADYDKNCLYEMSPPAPAADIAAIPENSNDTTQDNLHIDNIKPADMITESVNATQDQESNNVDNSMAAVEKAMKEAEQKTMDGMHQSASVTANSETAIDDAVNSQRQSVDEAMQNALKSMEQAEKLVSSLGEQTEPQA